MCGWYFVFVFTALADAQSPVIEFVSQPDDVTIKLGEKAIFSCEVRISAPFRTVTSSWSNGYTSYDTDADGPISIRTTVNSSDSTATSYLELRQATREDSGKYFQCKIRIDLDDYSTDYKSSSLVRLNVLYFITEGDLTCSGPTRNHFWIGESLNAECIAPKANPPVSLEWMLCKDGIQLEGTTDMQKYADRQVLIKHLVTSKNLLNQSICCVATSYAFVGQSANCSLGPFRIFHAPDVEVFSSHRILTPPLIKEVSLECRADSYPSVSEYSWSCDPPDVFRRCESNSASLTLRLVESIWTNGELRVLVNCSANNQVGPGHNSSHVSVIPDAISSIRPCKRILQNVDDVSADILSSLNSTLKSENMSSVNQSNIERKTEIHILHLPFPTEDLFLCLSNSSFTPHDGQYAWYIDGLIALNQEESLKIKNNLTNEPWTLHVPRSPESYPSNASHVIVCESSTWSDTHLAACSFKQHHETNHPTLSITSVPIVPTSETSVYKDYTIIDFANSSEAAVTHFPTHIIALKSTNNSKTLLVVLVALTAGSVLLASVFIVIKVGKKQLEKRRIPVTNAAESSNEPKVPSRPHSSSREDIMMELDPVDETTEEPVYDIPDDIGHVFTPVLLKPSRSLPSCNSYEYEQPVYVIHAPDVLGDSTGSSYGSDESAGSLQSHGHKVEDHVGSTVAQGTAVPLTDEISVQSMGRSISHTYYSNDSL